MIELSSVTAMSEEKEETNKIPVFDGIKENYHVFMIQFKAWEVHREYFEKYLGMRFPTEWDFNTVQKRHFAKPPVFDSPTHMCIQCIPEYSL